MTSAIPVEEIPRELGEALGEDHHPQRHQRQTSHNGNTPSHPLAVSLALKHLFQRRLQLLERCVSLELVGHHAAPVDDKGPLGICNTPFPRSG